MPPELVESIEQLIENAQRFDSYRGESRPLGPFWSKYMKRGQKFLHLVIQGENIFCPSIFAGYRNNEYNKYSTFSLKNEETDERINSLLGEARSDENSRISLREVLKANHIEFRDMPGQFWFLDEDTMAKPLEPRNRIFYGPPGTGKTYHTVNAALAIIDPDFDESMKRSELMNRFEELKNRGRIEFVTFHQSFSYEEFVEGLKATTGDNGQIAYEVQDGIFKILCERARAGKAYLSVDQALDQLKEECSEEPIPMQTTRNRKIMVSYPGKTTFRVDPVEGKTSDNPVNINSIRKVMLGEDTKGMYHPSYIKAIIKHIRDNYKIREIVASGEQKSQQDPHVLIIDEINRGNISRIFGELITLIEPSKRAGEENALSVTLPYSQESFSVPKNLYIIGTMNTADRSIALLDTALRRRFHFEEMMPNLTLLEEGVERVKIRKLLSVMNERIEALHDRDHQIGHTYFLPLNKDPSLEKLADIFRHSILPLLQEYFYDDWGKIDMVLGKNGFLKSINPPKILNLDDEKKLWRIAKKENFLKTENYQKIYKD